MLRQAGRSRERGPAELVGALLGQQENSILRPERGNQGGSWSRTGTRRPGFDAWFGKVPGDTGSHKVPAWRIPQTRVRRESDVAEATRSDLQSLQVDLVCSQLWLQGGGRWAFLGPEGPRLSALLSLSSESLQLLSRVLHSHLHQRCRLRSQSCGLGLLNFYGEK